MYRVIGVLCLLLLAACSPKPTDTTGRDQAVIHFQEGEAAFESGLYRDAIASWEKVRESYYSAELNTLAELKIAEAHFLAGDYPEASVAYEEFLKNHPDHARTADILYQLGIAYTHQIRSHDQDQTPTRNALGTFRTLKANFPDDPRMAEVDAYMASGLDQLASHELAIARFYLKTGHYGAAVVRLERIFKHYPEFDNKDQAYLSLGQAYFKNGDPAKATQAFEALFREFPGSEHTRKAQKFIDDYL